MSKQINISEARELFAKTTQGEWEAIVCVLSPRVYCDGEMICETHAAYLVDAGNHDMDWIAKVHNDYPAMLDEIERLRSTVRKQQAPNGT